MVLVKLIIVTTDLYFHINYRRRIPSSGIWRCAGFVIKGVLEEYVASMLRVDKSKRRKPLAPANRFYFCPEDGVSTFLRNIGS
jgi:hypothetical protein